jgi:hypothetical protein
MNSDAAMDSHASSIHRACPVTSASTAPIAATSNANAAAANAINIKIRITVQPRL